MNTNNTLATDTYLAMQELRPELPNLVGAADWPALESKLAALDAAWAAGDDGERRVIAMQYRDALAPWPLAYERLRALIGGASAYSNALRRLAVLAENAGEKATAAALREEAEVRNRIIIERGVGRPSYSVKLRNIDIRFWKLPALTSSVLGTVDAVADPGGSGITIAAAVLAAIGGLDALAREISVDDTSVFLGLVDAGGESRQAAMPDIIDATNTGRAAAPDLVLTPMTEEQVIESLNSLVRLGSIRKVDGQMVWRVIEEHGRV